MEYVCWIGAAVIATGTAIRFVSAACYNALISAEIVSRCRFPVSIQRQGSRKSPLTANTDFGTDS